MTKLRIFFLAAILFSIGLQAQVKPSQVEILRDSYGVPHIFGETDAATAYGLAWANAEDDFKTMQIGYLAGNGLLSKYMGLQGASADFVSQLIGGKEYVNAHYEKDISEEYKKVISGFSDGLNAYAAKHPKEVLLKELFPMTAKKLLTYTYLQLFVMSEADALVSAIAGNSTSKLKPKKTVTGSNTFAFNSVLTADGATYLAINPHQPLEGPTSWYEAHLQSEEGTNIVGALFPGAPSILLGTNESLGWAHTVNKPDKADIFALEMDPSKKDHYLVDGVSYVLEKFKAKLHIKFLGLRIPIKKKFYKSIYGPTLKNKEGVFAVRTPSLFEIRALEQWWRMNKAQNFTQFKEALEMMAIPGFNIGYADKNDTIFYVSNALIPKRAAGYDWTKIVPGNTKKTLWTENYAFKDMPQLLQPTSGYFYNTNHSPFISSGLDDRPKAEDFNKDMGFETFDNNRSERFAELVTNLKSIDFERFKKIKYDTQLPKQLAYPFMNIDSLWQLKANEYPAIEGLIKEIQNWDKKADPDSYGAGAYAIFYYQVGKHLSHLDSRRTFNKKQLATILKEVQSYMRKYFNKDRISLGEFTKVVRGAQELPSFGLPDVLAAMHGAPYKDGMRKIIAGESYIQLVKFSKEKTQIYSVVPFGSSNHPNNPHYADQLPLYMAGKTKEMPLEKAYWYTNFKRKYHPE